jgi:hypothetical protein
MVCMESKRGLLLARGGGTAGATRTCGGEDPATRLRADCHGALGSIREPRRPAQRVEVERSAAAKVALKRGPPAGVSADRQPQFTPAGFVGPAGQSVNQGPPGLRSPQRPARPLLPPPPPPGQILAGSGRCAGGSAPVTLLADLPGSVLRRRVAPKCSATPAGIPCVACSVIRAACLFDRCQCPALPVSLVYISLHIIAEIVVPVGVAVVAQPCSFPEPHNHMSS